MNLLNNFKLGRKNEYEVNLGLQSVEVRAAVRRVTAIWTPEMEFVGTNIETYNNVDAERELTRMLSEEMSRMIDDEIIQSLRGIADAIVPVQPMGEPTRRLFYFDYLYDINDFKFGR
jgi:hypothetical protein